MHLNPGANSCYVVECWNLSISCSLFFSYFVLALPLMFFLYSRNLQTSSCQQPTSSQQEPALGRRAEGGGTGDISRPNEVWNQSGKWATIFISLKTSQPPRSSTRRSPSFSPKQKSGDSSILRGHWGDRIQSPSVVEKRHQTTMISHNVALGLQGMVSGWWFLNKI